ncbi:MAG: DNA-nicking Smr family endonuclease [Sphingobacteriales bacterium]|jgi:DNA-nicking Smr family endonuclease
MGKIKLDLHPIFNNTKKIEQALIDAVDECFENNIKELEIIPGKGSGQLKKRVLRFLDQKEIKAKYKRIDKDAKNHGRIWVYFK